MHVQTRADGQPAVEEYSRLPISGVFDLAGSGPSGLEIGEATARLATHGPNAIREAPRRPVILTLLAEFTGPMAVLLWIAGVVALVAGLTALGCAVFAVVLINGVFAFWQEHRAERATEALKKLLAQHATVIRAGVPVQIPTQELVPGDLMVVEEGDQINADARLVESNDLRINQSTLTGESRPVPKHCGSISQTLPTAQQQNMVFTGTSVAQGNGRAVVTSTGMDTEFGRIAHLTQQVVSTPSPLQKELATLTRHLSLLALVLGMAFFVMAVLFVGQPWSRAFIFGLAMVVAFVPEGLLPTVSLSLALAVQRMARRNALVKKLSSVETLGCTTVICSDKTGTLTQNEMTVTQVWLSDAAVTVTGNGYVPTGAVLLAGSPTSALAHPGLGLALTAAVLCNDASLTAASGEGSGWTIHGDPTEAALLVAGHKAGLDPLGLAAVQGRVREFPFDTHRKRMSTVHRCDDRLRAYTKGAPQEVPSRCTAILRHGVAVPMTEDDRAAIDAADDALARRGLRVLAVAMRDLGVDQDPAALRVDDVEEDLTFLGLVAMQDPPREGIAEAVARCHQARIRIIMITGDYGLTAEAIARNIGIVRGPDARVVSGTQLQRITDDELVEVLRGEAIFARVAPEQKYRVVETLQAMGEVVAVTGDGVNDAPALKKADIGIAMGSGTDVSKEAADMILTDDHFSSIIAAIEEGRSVYDNIKRFLTYILTSNMAEAVPSAVFVFSRGLVPLPLTVMQILTIDLGTDLVPALGLGTERTEAGVMNRPPRDRRARLMDRRVLWLAFGWYGLLEALFAMTAYLGVNILAGWPGVPLAGSGEVYVRATTATLGAIIFSQIGAVLACRTSKQSLFGIGVFSNRTVLVGIVVEVVLLAALSYVPFLQTVFNTGPLQLVDWAMLSVLPVLMVALDEGRKALTRRHAAPVR